MVHSPLLILLLCGLSELSSARADEGPGMRAAPRAELSAEQQQLLLRVWELVDLASDGSPRPEILEKLGRLAAADPRPVFDVYAGVAVRDEGGRSADLAARAGLLGEALNSIEAAKLFRYLREALVECAMQTRLAAVELLAENADPHAVDLIWELLIAADPVQLTSPHVQTALASSLRVAFERQPRAMRAVAKDPQSLGPQIRPLVAWAAPRDAAGTELLLALLGLDAELERVVLERLGSQASEPAVFGSGRLQADVVEQVRARLDHEDWRVREQALVALGCLIDPDSLSAQIAMLEDEHRSVQRSARWALERATGQRFGSDRALWTAWLDEQTAWMREVGQAAERRLLGCSDAEAVALIRDLAQHRLFRHAASDMLAPVLFRENPSVVEVVCATLEHLGSPRAVGHLIEGLEHANPECRALIHRTLVELTGRELPPEQSAWVAALAP